MVGRCTRTRTHTHTPTFQFISYNTFLWLQTPLIKSHNDNSWGEQQRCMRYIQCMWHTQLWRSLTAQQTPVRCVHSAAPTPAPEGIPMPMSIIHTLFLPLYIPLLLQPIIWSKTTRPTSRSVRIIITDDWRAAFQWALVAFQVRLNKYFSLHMHACGRQKKMWKQPGVEALLEINCLLYNTNLIHLNKSRS